LEKAMNIVIYSKPNCPWCVKAKELMNKLNLNYDEKVLDVDYTRDELKQLMPENLPVTVPQIFVYNKRIGGYEDFAEWCDNHGYGNGQ
jgi:glutaredoxin